MNILLLNHYAGSPDMGMEFRPYYLAREWVKMGYNVRILAGDYSHLRVRNPQVDEDFQNENIDGIDYTWIKTGTYSGNGVKRAFSMFRFVGKIMKNAKMIAEQWKPDVVIASSTYPLDTFAAQKIKKLTGAKYIHEVHDMWPITLIELGGMKKSNPFVVLMQISENSFCKKSDKVVSLLCNAKDYFVKHGMAPEKFVNIMNGVVLNEWENPDPLPEPHKTVIDGLKKQGKFLVGFFGSITRSYAINYLIEAIQKLGDDRVAFIIVGDGNQLNELKKLASKTKSDCFYFLPKISKKSIPSLLDEMDCLYVGALHNDMFRFGICMNKLFESMMSGKPILYAVSAPNNFITDYDCGISVEPESADALVDGLKRMMSLTEDDRVRMGQNGQNAILNNYTYDKLAEQFAELFN
ncbi:MAG: glycosyltransferase family 4 protein [Eubacterium sp.]|jgi:glycosyltransferase involved in cell wall biosynthesis